MAIITVQDWIPDAADFGNPGSITVTNALPGLNSYQPLGQFVSGTGPLDSRPLGAIEAKDKDLNVFQYAGDAGKIYSLAGTSWDDVSLGGGYSTGAGERWEFVRWKEKIIATNFTDDPQSMTLGGSNFADMTTALRFRHVAVVRDFVVAGNTFDGGDGNVRDRVRWCAINDETNWTVSPITLADFRDLKSGGGIQRVIGGEFGVICAEKSTWRMTWAGSPVVFQIDEVLPGIGALAPGGVVAFGDSVFFASEQGFIALQGGASGAPIGAGRVDQFFINDVDQDHLDKISSVADPKSGKVFWAYPGAGNTDGRPNKMIVYDRTLNKWGYFEYEQELIWRSGGVATTLEQLDDFNLGMELATNGDFAADTDWSKGTGWTIAAGVATHAVGSVSSINQTTAVTEDTYYRAQFDVIGRTAGSIFPVLGGGPIGTAVSLDGTAYLETLRCGVGNQFTFQASSDFDGSIDNVSVKDIDDLDTMSVSLDSLQWKGDAALLASFDSAFTNGNFSGVPFTAIIETKETEIHTGFRTRLNAFIPLVDGGDVTARVGTRNRQSDDVSFSTVLTQSSSGRFTNRSNAKFHRFELTASGDWKNFVGVQVNKEDAKKAERRG